MDEKKPTILLKYREAPRKGWWRLLTVLLPAGALILTVMHWFYLRPGGWVMYPLSFLFMLVMAFLPLNFLWIPMTKKSPRDHIPWYDIVAAALSIGIPAYYWVNQMDVMVAGWDIGAPLVPTILAIILWGLVVEAARRSGGIGLMSVVLVFSTLPLWSCHSPMRILWGPCSDFLLLASMQVISEMGLMGLVMGVFGELIMGFMTFAVVVQSTGAGQFFNDLAVALVANTRGGNAKVAIVASGFFASISGAAVPNVMTTGAFTIPAMKQDGLPGYFAGAVEATASTGGNFTPPVMGAVAFLMAEFIGVPYAEICLAAAVPAFLYFFCLFVQIDAYAARIHLKPRGVTTEVPSIRRTLLGNFHIIGGFFVLVAILFLLRVDAQAPYYASLAVILMAMTMKSKRFGLKGFINIFESLGRTLADLLPILASVGLIIGGLTFTGIALSIPHEIAKIAGGNSYILLLIGAIAALILGMGMTVSAVYIFLAIIVAPSLVQFGFNQMAVHLFIIYTGMLSLITPPVALAAFAAASIAEASPMRTGFQAMRLGGALYILPFIFVLNPALILRGTVADIFWVIPTAAIGLAIIGGALEGYMWRVGSLTFIARAIWFASGIMVVWPDLVVSLVGIGIFLVVFGVVKLLLRSGSSLAELLITEPTK